MLLLGGHVIHGGFYYDDWKVRSVAHFGGFGSTLDFTLDVNNRRPVGNLWTSTIFTVLGGHARAYLALALCLHLALCGLLYGILRQLGFSWLQAVAGSALLLLFPGSDSTWLWATAAQMTLSVVFLLAGLLLGLSAVTATGRRSSLLKIAAIVMYASAVLTYELVAPAAMAAGALYLVRAPRRRAVRAWAVDVVSLSVVIVIFTLRLFSILPGKDVHATLSRSKWAEHARLLFEQGHTLLARSIVPFGDPSDGIVFAVAAAVVVASLAFLARLPSEHQLRSSLRRWLILAAVGLALLPIGWVLLIPSDLYYVPLQVGVGNRINVVAAMGCVLVALALAGLVGTLAARVRPEARGISSVVTMILAAVVAVGYAHDAARDQDSWRAATTAQNGILRSLSALLPRPERSSTVLTVGAPLFTAPGVPIFAAAWDLDGAVKLRYDDSSLSAHPISPGSAFACRAGGFAFRAPYAKTQVIPLRRAVVVDLARSRVAAVQSPRACTRVVTALRAGGL